MKRIFIFAATIMFWLAAMAQPKGMQPRSTYEMADEVRKELNLNQKQFEKVYSAYEKYNKTVFGDVDKNGMFPTPPAGGPRGGHGGGGMGMPPGGGGRPGFGAGGPVGGPGGHGGFDGQRPGRPGSDGPNMRSPKPEDIQKMEKKRANAEEKLVKSMQKLFKKDPTAFSRWQTIRERQLKQVMPPMRPFPGGGPDMSMPNGDRQ